MAVGSFLYWSSTSGGASAKTAQFSHHVISPNEKRSLTHDPRRDSSDNVIDQTSLLLQLSPSCPCPSSAEVEACDDVYLKHKSAAAKTAAVGNVIHVALLPPPMKEVMFSLLLVSLCVCLFVCLLSVNKITQKVVDGFTCRVDESCTRLDQLDFVNNLRSLS